MSDPLQPPWTAACQTSVSFTISRSLVKLMCIESVMSSNCLILCYPPLLFYLPSVFPSIRVFSSESAVCIIWPKYWSFSFSNSPSNEYSGLISFRIDWVDLLAVQRTLKTRAPQFDASYWFSVFRINSFLHWIHVYLFWSLCFTQLKINIISMFKIKEKLTDVGDEWFGEKRVRDKHMDIL